MTSVFQVGKLSFKVTQGHTANEGSPLMLGRQIYLDCTDSLKPLSWAWSSQVHSLALLPICNGGQLKSKRHLKTTGLDQQPSGWAKEWTHPAEPFEMTSAWVPPPEF